MASNSGGGEDKDNDSDTKDVQLARGEKHLVDPTPSNASALTQSRLPATKAASVSTETYAQDGKTSDPLTTTGTRRLEVKNLDSAVASTEHAHRDRRHCKQSTRVQTTWVNTSLSSIAVSAVVLRSLTALLAKAVWIRKTVSCTGVCVIM